MSYDLIVYLRNMDDGLIAPWMKKMAENGLICEFHPEFSFTAPSGFLPVKVRVLKSTVPELTNRDYLACFELYRDVYDHRKNRDESGLSVRCDEPSSFWSIVFPVTKESRPRFPLEIESILQKATIQITLFRGEGNPMEIITAWYAAATLCGLGEGLLYHPQERKYYHSHEALKQARKVQKGIELLNVNFHRLIPFRGWGEIGA